MNTASVKKMCQQVRRGGSTGYGGTGYGGTGFGGAGFGGTGFGGTEYGGTGYGSKGAKAIEQEEQLHTCNHS